LPLCQANEERLALRLAFVLVGGAEVSYGILRWVGPLGDYIALS
tara:strand:- start:128 stop:259 length:132 start_codon:yes stop_codon:yes gene_type:complete